MQVSGPAEGHSGPLLSSAALPSSQVPACHPHRALQQGRRKKREESQANARSPSRPLKPPRACRALSPGQTRGKDLYKPLRGTIAIPPYGGGNWGSEKLSDWGTVTQRWGGRIRIRTQAAWLQSLITSTSALSAACSTPVVASTGLSHSGCSLVSVKWMAGADRSQAGWRAARWACHTGQQWLWGSWDLVLPLGRVQWPTLV